MSYIHPTVLLVGLHPNRISDKTIVLQSLELAPSLDQLRSPKLLTSSAPLLPTDKLGIRFCQWFRHSWNWIYASLTQPGKKLDWLTENRYPLQPRNLWQEYKNPEKIIGLRFGNDQTSYCLLDIDRGSPYHPTNDRAQFQAVIATLESIGLCRPLFVRSSQSEGLHVYYFLLKPAPTFALACAIRFALEDAGLNLQAGQLEAFPNTKAFSKEGPTNYNGHRLPLQAGSYWLDSDGLPKTDDLGQFLDAADLAAANQNEVALQQAITAATKNRRRLKYTPESSSKAEAWKRHLEERIAEGWTGRGQTNELLKDFATYGVVWVALKGKALVDFVVKTAQAAPGYTKNCRHEHRIHARATEWAKSAEKFYSPYRSYPKRDGTLYKENFVPSENNIVRLENQANAKTRELAAERIRQAMDHLEATSTLPHTPTARAAAIIATTRELTGGGISLSTLHQNHHLELWHPGRKKTPEPSQGALLHPNLEVDTLEKTPEPSQGALLHPNSLYEGLGRDELPDSPPQGEADQQLIQPLEFSLPPAPVAATDEPPEVQPATGDSPPEVWRLVGIRLAAQKRAKNLVKQRSLEEGRNFSPEVRQRLETVALMQFLWDSEDPVWRYEVRSWSATNRDLNFNPELQNALYDAISVIISRFSSE